MTNKELKGFLNLYKDETEIRILSLDFDGDYHTFDICGIELTNHKIYLKDHTNAVED